MLERSDDGGGGGGNDDDNNNKSSLRQLGTNLYTIKSNGMSGMKCTSRKCNFKLRRQPDFKRF